MLAFVFGDGSKTRPSLDHAKAVPAAMTVTSASAADVTLEELRVCEEVQAGPGLRLDTLFPKNKLHRRHGRHHTERRMPVQPVRQILTRLSLRMEAAAMDPLAAQTEALARLVRTLGNTDLGRAQGLHRVRAGAAGLEDLRRLPELTPTELQTRWARPLAQAPDTVPGRVGRGPALAFGQTSGTTGEAKLFPLNRDYIAAYHRSALRIQAAFLHRTGLWHTVRQGRGLSLTARPEVSRTGSGVPVGFVSGLMRLHAPTFTRGRMLPTLPTLRETDWEARLQATLGEAVAQGRRISMIGGIPSMVQVFTQEALRALKADQLCERWPELTLMLSGGVALTPATRTWFKRHWGQPRSGKLHFWELYAATEGQLGYTFDPDWPGMVFESFENAFVFEAPEGPVGGGPRTLLHELEQGRRYRVLITTPGGLVQYGIGDVIEVLSTRPLTFRVTGRQKDDISLATEKISPEQIEQALARADLACEHWAVWAVEGPPHRLHLVLARRDGPARLTPATLASPSPFDQALQAINPSYGELRLKDLVYGPPVLYSLSTAPFDAYVRANLHRGQFKGRRVFDSQQIFCETLRLS